MIPKRMQRGLRVITLQEAIKCNITIAILENQKIYSNIIISHFGDTNNIFADYRKKRF